MTTKVSGQMTRSVTIYVGSVAELEGFSGQIQGQSVNVIPSDGSAEFSAYWDASSTSDPDGYKTFKVSGVDPGRWKRAEPVDFNLTQFCEREKAIFEDDGPYTAWPYGCMFKDTIAGEEFIMQAYTAGAGHVAADKKIYFRRRKWTGLKAGGEWGARIDIDGGAHTGDGLTVHAAGRVPNGDYIAIARFGEPVTATYVYRSTDNGLTWDSGTQLANAGGALNPREAGSIFVTQAGTVLSGYGSGGGDGFVLRSTDNGNTWENYGASLNTAIDKTAVGGTPLEPSFIQLESGEIISVWRATIGSDYSSSTVASIYSISTDDGLSWSSFAFTNLQDQNNNPSAMIYHPEDRVVEILYGSRYSYASDGFSSLYQAFATPETIINGEFFGIRRIGVGSGTRDFGYPAMVKMNDGTVVGAFYNGNDVRTTIQNIYGRKMTVGGLGSSQIAQKAIPDPMTGRDHANFNIDGSVGLDEVRYVRHKGQAQESAIRIRGDKNYYGGSTIVRAAGDVTSTSETIDVKTILEGAGRWNEYIGGLVVLVKFRASTGGNISFQVGAQVGSTNYTEIVAREYGTAPGYTESEMMVVPINTVTAGGELYFSPSSPADWDFLEIRAFGYSSKN